MSRRGVGSLRRWTNAQRGQQPENPAIQEEDHDDVVDDEKHDRVTPLCTSPTPASPNSSFQKTAPRTPLSKRFRSFGSLRDLVGVLDDDHPREPAPEFARMRPQNLSEETLSQLKAISRARRRNQPNQSSRRAVFTDARRITYLEQRIDSSAKIIAQLRAEVLSLETRLKNTEDRLLWEREQRLRERRQNQTDTPASSADPSPAKPPSSSTAPTDASAPADASAPTTQSKEEDPTDRFIRRHFSMENMEDEKERQKRLQQEQLRLHRQKRRSRQSLRKEELAAVRAAIAAGKAPPPTTSAVVEEKPHKLHIAVQPATPHHGQAEVFHFEATTPQPPADDPNSPKAADDETPSSAKDDTEEKTISKDEVVAQVTTAPPPSDADADATESSSSSSSSKQDKKVEWSWSSSKPKMSMDAETEEFMKNHFDLEEIEREERKRKEAQQAQLKAHREKRKSRRSLRKSLKIKTSLTSSQSKTSIRVQPATPFHEDEKLHYSDPNRPNPALECTVKNFRVATPKDDEPAKDSSIAVVQSSELSDAMRSAAQDANSSATVVVTGDAASTNKDKDSLKQSLDDSDRTEIEKQLND